MPVVSTSAVSSITAETATCGGNVTSDSRSSVTARGVCWAKTEYPTVNDAHTTNGTGKGEFQSQLTELEHNAIYYVRAYATNSQGTAYGEQFKFTTTEGVAVVVTDSVYNITAHTAKCRAHVVSDGGFAVTKRGICWSNRPDPTIDDNITEDGSGLGEYTATLKDLVENTTYYIRAYATNSTTTVYGEQITITTLDGLAVVLTDSISSITATTLTAHGTVVSDCDIPVTACGFCYATMQNPTIENDHTTSGKGLGTFQSNIINLQTGTTYYIRAYATNETGTVYGAQLKVTMQEGLPVVQFKQAVSTATSISVTGEVLQTGGFAVTERGVCYSTMNSEPAVEDGKVLSGKGKGAFSASITGLTAATTYYLRAYAVNENGTVYSDVHKVETKNGAATATIGEIQNITALTASGSVTVTDVGGATLQNCGICWATTPNPTIEDSKAAGGNQLNTAYTCNMTGLTPAATYYVRAYATTDITTSYSEQISFRLKDGAATATIGEIKNITALTASCSVNVTDAGGGTLQNCGICWATTPNPTIEDSKTAGGNQLNTAYTCNLTQLTPATTYYVRGYATTDITTAYSEQVTFTTYTGLPDLTTTTTTATSTQITSGGNIARDGGYNITARGVCYSTTNSSPTIEDSYTTAGVGTGAFSTIITDVKVSTTYYVRAYATNSIGTSYGGVMKVVTGNGLPVVTTTAITKNGSSFLSGGHISDDGGSAVTARGICYGTFPHPDMSDTYSHTSDGTGTGYYTSTIGLTTGVIYVRAYATNANGTSYGAEITMDLDYLSLPTFVFNNKTYRVAPNAPEVMSWYDAKTYCDGLVLYGYSDWRMPDYDELYQMYLLRTSIGGFILSDNDNTSYTWPTCYWYNVSSKYIDFSRGISSYTSSSSSYRCSVRPIREEK